MRKLEREVIYPTGNVKDESEGPGEGPRLSMPEGYDELGARRERPPRMPWRAIALVGIVLSCVAKWAA